MSDLRQAAQQALEAMEGELPDWRTPAQTRAVIALRDALAQEEQEPVAWMVYTEDGKSAYVTDNPHDLVGAYKAFALYTHPPRREWQGLTEEEINHHWHDTDWRAPLHDRIAPFARAVEQALKEKNNG